MAFVVYLITNTVNGKRYVGKTSESRWTDRRYEHRTRMTETTLSRAIRKHGWEAFECKIVFRSDSESAVLAKEVWFIKHLQTVETGYNLTIGGDGASGYRHTPSQVAKRTGRRRSDATRRLISEMAKRRFAEPEEAAALNGHYRSWWQSLSEEEKTRRNAENSARVRSHYASLTDEQKAAHAARGVGRKDSPETREKKRAAHYSPEVQAKLAHLRLPESVALEVRAMLERGDSVQTIVKITGVSNPTVYKIRRRMSAGGESC